MKDLERIRLNAIIHGQRENLRELNEIRYILKKEIARLQERLADADKTINFYDSKDFHYTLPDGTVMGKEPAHQYKLKWGVK